MTTNERLEEKVEDPSWKEMLKRSGRVLIPVYGDILAWRTMGMGNTESRLRDQITKVVVYTVLIAAKYGNYVIIPMVIYDSLKK